MNPRSFLLSILLLLPSLLHAGGLDYAIFSGEKGRPKVIPRFETWEGDNTQKRDGITENLTVYTLDSWPLKLSSLWAEKPVLIVHSSLTCPISRDNCPHVDRIKADFGDQIEVVVLYTTEAHPIGSPSPYSEGGKLEWITDRNHLEKVLVDEPQTLPARLKRAQEYKKRQEIKSRVVADGMDNKVWKFFGGGPNTAIFIDTKGIVRARQGWLKPSLMAGQIRSYFARTDRNLIREKLKKSGLEFDIWTITPASISAIAKQVPEILTYHLNSKAAYHDETLLHLATTKRHHDIFLHLLALGAPTELQDQSGLTPLHYALKSSRKDENDLQLNTIKLLLEKGASSRARSDKLESATHFAVQSEKLSHLKLALEAGSPLDNYSIDGISPLHESLFQNTEAITKHLLTKGSAVDIFAAAGLGDLKQVKRFLAANPHSWNLFQGDSGRSPLIYAAISGKTEVVKFLLDQQNDEQRYSNEQLVACLKKANANNNTESALAIVAHTRPLTGEKAPAPTQSLTNQVPPRENYYVIVNLIIHEAAMSNNTSLLAALLNRGWDVDTLNLDQQTPLHAAAEEGSVEAIEFLLKNEADLEAKSGEPAPVPCGPPGPQRKNRTPLHLAVISRQILAVDTLLKHGAKLTYNDTEGFTPLAHALPDPYTSVNRGQELQKLKKIIRILMKAGADPDHITDYGKSFRDRAAEPVEHHRSINGEWQNLGKLPRSEEILKFLDELENK